MTDDINQVPTVEIPAWVILDPTGNWILVSQGMPAPAIRAFGVIDGAIDTSAFKAFWSTRPAPPHSMEQCVGWLLEVGYVEGEVTIQMLALTITHLMEVIFHME